MSSERRREPAPGPSRRPRAAGGSPVARRDTAQGAAREGAASRGRALGYDPDDPATWPGAQQETAAPAAPAPGDGEGAREAPKELTDAKGMRALAHPVRLSLIDLFSYNETLTATQASDLLDESPANCAFHLRTLAKYGFVREAGGGRGRERPWTMVNRVVRINPRQADPQAALAADELSRVMLERWIERARQALGAPNTVPGWSGASGWSRVNVFMTPDEAMAVQDQINNLLGRFEARQSNPALRPPGALPVEWASFTWPIADWVPPDGDDPAPGAASETEA